MKVVIASYSLHPRAGGPANSLPLMGASLVARGVDLSYWTASGKVHQAPSPSASIARAVNADVIHSFGIWQPFDLWVSLIARLARQPMVICPMGMLEPWSLSQQAFKKRIALSLYQRKVLDQAQALHVTADYEVGNLRRLGLKAPVALMTHGVSVPSELPARAEDEQAPMTKTAVFLSRLHPKKGLLDLVRVWARLRPDGWRVVVAGPDEHNYRAEVESAIADAGLQTAFTFEGHVSQERKSRLLFDADLFVLPTYSENFGAVIPEAMAHGLPVVTTTGAPWGALTETRSGWWVEPGEAGLQGALQQALSLELPELRAMGLRGRQLVKDRYSWDSVIHRHLELYSWLLTGNNKPDFVFD